MAFDEARFDHHLHGVQPVVQCQAHSPIWLGVPISTAEDNGGAVIIDPHDGVTISAALMELVGTDPTGGGVPGRLIPIAPGSGLLAVAQLTVTEAHTTTVQIWRVHPALGGPWAVRRGGGGLPLGFLENAIRDADAANVLTLDSGPATAPRIRVTVTDDGQVVPVRSGGTQVFVGNWTEFPARGASHVIVTVQARSDAAASTGVMVKTY